jgi:hypothetical protein
MTRAYSSGDGSSPSPEQLREFQRRMGPPENELPGAIAFRAVVGRTDEFVVAIVGADAYSTGISISIAIRLRRSDRSEPGLAHELFGHRHRGAGGGELLVGVVYPDGRTASTVSPTSFPDPLTDLDQPTLMQGGGGGGGRSFNTDYWLSPLPPPGDLTIVVAWPTHGIDETHTLMPGDLIANGLAHNVELWPWESPADHDDPPTPAPPVLPEGGWFAEHMPDNPAHTSETP